MTQCCSALARPVAGEDRLRHDGRAGGLCSPEAPACDDGRDGQNRRDAIFRVRHVRIARCRGQLGARSRNPAQRRNCQRRAGKESLPHPRRAIDAWTLGGDSLPSCVRLTTCQSPGVRHLVHGSSNNNSLDCAKRKASGRSRNMARVRRRPTLRETCNDFAGLWPNTLAASRPIGRATTPQAVLRLNGVRCRASPGRGGAWSIWLEWANSSNPA